MVDPNTRQGKRTPVTLKIKFKSETLEQFIERYAVDVSQGGIFIRTKEPLAVGTQMKFEFQLRDASPLIGGEGTVVWTRENDPSRPAIAPGMGVRFDRLAEGSQSVLERILSEKAKQSPSRPSEVTKPPMFTDTPTRVAPAPVQDALLGRSPSGRSRADSFSETSNTPLPRPMPFHSDADDFDERAFEEATKVRSLDELAQQSIGDNNDSNETATNILSPAAADELLGRTKRADSTLADAPSAFDRAPAPAIGRTTRDREAPATLPPPESVHEPEPSRPGGIIIDRDSAPGLPSPPVAAPKVLDSPAMVPAKTQLGVEPARVETRQRDAVAPPLQVPSIKDSPTRPTGLQAVPTPKPAVAKERAASPAASSSQHLPSAGRPSSAPIVIGILVALAAIGGAVWFFVLRPDGSEEVAKKPPPPTPGSGSDLAVTPPPDNGGSGSAGSGSAVIEPTNGSGSAAMTNGSGSAAVTPAKADTVETVIASNIEKSTVEVVGEGQTGPAPFTAKLEKGKAYKIKISAARYADKIVDVKGGDPKVVAKLDAKPSTIHVESDPPGATIYVDNAATTVKTPGDVTLTAAQAARRTIHISVRMSGKKSFDQILDTATLTEGADKITGKVDAGKLATMVVIQRPNPPPDRTGSGSGSATNNNGNGSDAVTPDKGSGAEKPPEKPPTPPTPPAGGSGEPEPDWTKKNN